MVQRSHSHYIKIVGKQKFIQNKKQRQDRCIDSFMIMNYYYFISTLAFLVLPTLFAIKNRYKLPGNLSNYNIFMEPHTNEGPPSDLSNPPNSSPFDLASIFTPIPEYPHYSNQNPYPYPISPLNLRPLMKQNLASDPIDKHSSPQQYDPFSTPSSIKKNPVDYENVFLIDVFMNNKKDSPQVLLNIIQQNGKRAIVTVNNIYKSLYFVLKSRACVLEATSQIRDLLRMHRIEKYQMSFKDMKYVFEIEGIARGDVKVCEVRYPPDPQITLPCPAEKGYTFTYIIGTTYTLIEIFIIRNKIKGPQWIRIPKKQLQKKQDTSRKHLIYLELNQSESIDAETLRDKPMPPLRVMCISLKVGKPSDMNFKLKKGFQRLKDQFVIYNLCYVFKQEYDLRNPSNRQNFTESQSYYLTEFGKPNIKSNQPFNTTPKAVEDQNLLLSFLISRISVLEPDVLVCHDFNSSIDILTMKLGYYQNDNLRKLGRVYFGDYITGSINADMRINALLKGRLLVDTMKHAEDSGKTSDRKLSTLSSMLNLAHLPQIDYSASVKMVQSGEFTSLYCHTYHECVNILQVLSNLQILQITQDLAKICGYTWQKVIAQNRAQRNEYLIMHACYQQNYLIPDKFSYQQQGYDGKYQGGMVLEPKKGLHSGLVVLLDFVSLYPSIIREYNICFSKVQRNLLPLSHYVKFREPCKQQQLQQQFMVVPPTMQFCTEENWGFLPKLINLLVNQRQKYKKLMKEALTPSEKSSYNTIQTAYKLVANSIYGLLGYERSRFYSRDLASLITRLGRQSLQNAQDVIQNWKSNNQNCFQIIYGDTDSLMIKILQNHKNIDVSSELQKAIGLCQSVSFDINSFYNIMKMQIDSVYSSILLVSKKKYAGRKLKNLSKIVAHDGDEQVKPHFELEYKGVETIRNDSSQLLKEVTSRLFEVLLQPSKNVCDICSEVFNYFRELNITIDTYAENDPNKFVIRKVLSKHPNSYLKDKGLYYVQVAKNMVLQGHNPDSLINHMIEYVMVLAEANKEQLQAVDINSFLRLKGKEGSRTINKKYYKQKQIFPVVQRMLAQVSQIDISTIKQIFLGIKVRKRGLISQQESKECEEEQNSKVECKQEERNFKLQQIDFQAQQMFGLIKCCLCNQNNKITRNGAMNSCCINSTCKQTLIPNILNLLSMHFFNLIRGYYAEKNICPVCSRKWCYTVKKCGICPTDLSKKPIEHLIHQKIYLVKKLINSMLQKHPSYQQQCQPLLFSLEELLQSSQFEVIKGGMFSKLKYT